MQEKSEPIVSSEFAAALAVAIRDSGISKRAFAEKVGVTHTAINNYLTGRTPKLEEAMRMARFLGMTVDELIFGRSTPGADGAVWKTRALAAEQKLEAVKAGLVALLKKI